MKRMQIIFILMQFSISDKEWGLPLAIAANLHLPYRIQIGLDGFADFQNMDAFDRRK